MSEQKILNFDAVAMAYLAHANQALDDKKFDRAFELYEQALKLDNRLAEAWNNMGHIYQKRGKPEAAMVCFGRACALIPDSPLFLSNLGDVLWELRQYGEAEYILRKCLELDPKRAAAWHDLAMVLVCQGRIDDALDTCAKTIDCAPDSVLAIRARALAYLYSGQFELGFKQFELHGADIFDDEQRFPIPQWTGNEDIRGKVLYIHCNQGIGDWFQFSRYVSMIKGPSRIIMDPPPEAVKLFDLYLRRPEVPLTIRPMMGGLQTTANYHVNLMALPYALAMADGSGLVSVSGEPYIQCPPASYDIRWPLGTTKKIGIVWGGNPQLKVDNIRSACIDDFVVNLALPGFELYSLQFGERGRQQYSEQYHPLVHDLANVMTDFCETAALMKQMDVIVAVDTSCIHLAGALGIPAHVCVRSHNPDWRWVLKDGEHCCWYDSVTVHRQGPTEKWSSVLARVAKKLMEN